jgi:hypothetical protein
MLKKALAWLWLGVMGTGTVLLGIFLFFAIWKFLLVIGCVLGVVWITGICINVVSQ